jgi:signal transduction histidine kinase
MQLIEDLLDMSRIITGKLCLHIAPLDLESVIGAAIDAVRPALDAKGLALHTSLAPAARRINGDAARLQQVVWDLLANAVKFTPAQGQITVQLTSLPDAIRLEVADTGQGISPEGLPYVFDRFRQGEHAMTRSVGGLGLGLSIVRHLMELHGGTVHATSEGEGRGATMTVMLPRTDQ